MQDVNSNYFVGFIRLFQKLKDVRLTANHFISFRKLIPNTETDDAGL